MHKLLLGAEFFTAYEFREKRLFIPCINGRGFLAGFI
jgi:hypothetical protein